MKNSSIIAQTQRLSPSSTVQDPLAPSDVVQSMPIVLPLQTSTDSLLSVENKLIIGKSLTVFKHTTKIFTMI